MANIKKTFNGAKPSQTLLKIIPTARRLHKIIESLLFFKYRIMIKIFDISATLLKPQVSIILDIRYRFENSKIKYCEYK